MSNLEKEPEELVAEATAAPPAAVEILEPREVPLGGPRAMPVRRTLPQRGRSLIGAWCFADHYGPDDVSVTGGMHVPPHPHTGLQTVSWLFAGEIEHRDSTGAHAMVHPGELNLMTAGAGIQHSEVSTAETTTLHGVQLWTVMPDANRHGTPFFEHYVPPVFTFQGASVSIFLGSLLGMTSAATAFTPLLGAQFDLPPNTTVTIPVREDFEHGVLVDSGDVTLDGVPVAYAHIGYRAPGASELTLNSGDALARIILLGGEPFEEQIIMWWNFIGRSHDEVVASRANWMAEVIEGATHDGQFGHVDGYEGPPLPAPQIPLGRLKPRQ